MSKVDQSVIERRGELLAELFLQDLHPEFVARSSADFGYDFLVGFPNSRGGINNIPVTLKATERLPRGSYVMPRRQFDRLANSNVPALLLVVDVKDNRLFFAWLTPDLSTGADESDRVRVPLTEINDLNKEELLNRLTK